MHAYAVMTGTRKFTPPAPGTTQAAMPRHTTHVCSSGTPAGTTRRTCTHTAHARLHTMHVLQVLCVRMHALPARPARPAHAACTRARRARRTHVPARSAQSARTHVLSLARTLVHMCRVQSWCVRTRGRALPACTTLRLCALGACVRGLHPLHIQPVRPIDCSWASTSQTDTKFGSFFLGVGRNLLRVRVAQSSRT